MRETIWCALVDVATVSMALYIIFVGVGRLAMMSWCTHRKIWQAIYFLLVISAALYLKETAEGAVNHAPLPTFFLMLATAAWFHESRNRWLAKAPDYMAINCPHLPADEMLPNDCPLSKSDHGDC